MNKLRVLLVAAALLTAACGTATISGSNVKSVSNSGTVRVDAGANAGTDVSGSGQESDLARTNPTIRKGPGGPVPVQQSPAAAPGTNGTQPSMSGSDRCSAGYPGNTGVGPRAGGGGIKHPLPQCAVE